MTVLLKLNRTVMGSMVMGRSKIMQKNYALFAKPVHEFVNYRCRIYVCIFLVQN